tara:strand:+ start:487 stop:1314 length:828 start_codon:yes stop_codon:yes gene_type:complete
MRLKLISASLYIVLLISLLFVYKDLRIKIKESFISPINIKDIYQYSLIINLENDKLSHERLIKMRKKYIKYNLPLNLFPGLNWKKDKDILNQYPIIRNKPNLWESEWGFAGSFYKALSYAYKNNYPYLLFLENDSIPIYEDPATFYRVFNYALKNLPDNGTNIYFLGYNEYCGVNNKKNKRGWVKRYDMPSKYIGGSHSILFSKDSIIKIFNYLKYKKIDKPIDNWFKYLERMKILSIWYWEGDLSKNKMFCGLFRQLDTGCKRKMEVLRRNYTK